jgi:FkbM family methyltransferase
MTTQNTRIDIGGRTYVMSSDDAYLDGFSEGFEPDMVRLFRAVVPGGAVAFDIGANVGCTTLLFATIAQHVYAFEPSPSTFSFLQRNIARSALANISPFNLGMGAETADLTLTFARSNRSGGFVSNRMTASAGHVVEKITISTLDMFMASENIRRLDFIKIDVEGFEGYVLKGAQAALAAHRPIVVLELNHWCLNAFQRTSVPDFFDQLRAIFPLLYAVDGATYLDLLRSDESYHVMYHHILRGRYPNILGGFEENQVARFHASFAHRA